MTSFQDQVEIAADHGSGHVHMGMDQTPNHRPQIQSNKFAFVPIKVKALSAVVQRRRTHRERIVYAKQKVGTGQPVLKNPSERTLPGRRAAIQENGGHVI